MRVKIVIPFDFFDRRPIKKLTRLVGADGVLGLQRLWIACAMDPDLEGGDLKNMNHEDIEMACDWDGETGLLAKALIECGLVEEQKGALSVCQKFVQECMPEPSKKRKNTGRISAHKRWHSQGKHDNKPEPNCPLCVKTSDGTSASPKGQTKNGSPIKKHGSPNGLPMKIDGSPMKMDGSPMKIHGSPIFSPAPEEKGQTELSVVKSVVDHVSDKVNLVWQHYRSFHPRCPQKLKPGRQEYEKIKKLIVDDGWEPEAICDSISGYHASPWHNGENEGGTIYLGLELMIRNTTQVQKGLGYLDASKTPVLSEKTKRSGRAAVSWAERMSSSGKRK